MTIDSTEVHLAPYGDVYVAPVGTALPANATVALNASFSSLGYIDEDGVSITPGVDVTEINMWQSATPVKTTLDTISLEVSFNMGQINQTTWGLFFFVGSWTNNFGQAKMTVPSNPGSQEKAIIIWWQDENNDDYRLVIPRAFLKDRETLQLVRNNAQLTGVTFGALDNSGTLCYVLSENADLIPSS